MAKLRIVIEGEMTPEEMRQYIASAWGTLPAGAVLSGMEEPSGTVEVPVVEAVQPVAKAPPFLESVTIPEPIPETIPVSPPEPEQPAAPAPTSA